MKKHIIPFLILFVLMASCERYEDADIDLPYKNKLVAVTFLEEGSDSISLILTRTQPVFESPLLPSEAITDADVYIRTSRETLKLSFNEQISQYTGKLHAGVLLAGETCRISILQNNEEVTGSTVIPVDVTSVISVKSGKTVENGYYLDVYDVKYKIQEPGTYNVLLHASVVYSDSSVVPLIVQTGDLSTNIQKITSGIEMQMRFRSLITSNDIHPVRLEIIPQLCNDDYTNYHLSISSDLSLGLGTTGSEAVLIYSNMSNRIGITAAYNILPAISVDL
jgi:hypothetical protein